MAERHLSLVPAVLKPIRPSRIRLQEPPLTRQLLDTRFLLLVIKA